MREEDNMNTYSVAAVIKATGADQFIKDFQNAQKSVEAFVKANEQSFESMQKVGKFAMAGGLAIGAGLGIAVKTAADFESAMSQVKAISGATGSDFESLRAKAIEMGNATMFSASESADAMSNLAQMGWKTDQILGGIEHTLNLAAAGGLELAESAMITANTMNQFGLEAEEAERVADVFALTASSAGTDVIQMGDAMQYAGANAAAAGMSIEETSAFIGVLGDAGITGSKAGTSLNAMLRDLKQNSEDGAIAVGNQSVALYDAEGNMRNMPDVIGEIIKSTDEMSTSQRDAALSAIFGDQALVGFNAIAGKGADSVADLAGELYDSKGAAAEMAETMQDNLSGSITELSSALEGVQIAIGSALIPAIRLATIALKSLADWFNGLSDTAKSSVAVFLAITSVVLTLGGAFLLLVGSLPFIMNGFTHLKNVLGLARIAMLKFNAAILMNPMTWVVAGIVAAAALIYIYWEPIKGFFINLWNSIKDGAMFLWEVINNKWGGQIEALKAVVIGLANYVINAWDYIYNLVQPIAQSVVDFIMNLWSTLSGWWSSNQDGFLDKVITLWDGIKSAISTAISTIVAFVMEVWGSLVEWWNEHGQMIQEAAMNVWTVISTIITSVVGFIVSVIQFSFELIQTIVLTVFDAIFAAVEFVWPYILEAITFAIDGIWVLMQFVWPFIEMLIIDTWNAIVNVIQGAIDIILGVVQFFAALFTGNWSEMWEATKQIFSGALQLVWGLINLWFIGKILKGVKLFAQGFRTVISTVWNAVKSLFTAGVNVAKSVVTAGFNLIRSVITSVMNVVRSIISSVWNAIRSVISSVVNGIRSVITGGFNSIRNIVTSVSNAIRSVISSVFNALSGIVSGAMSGVRSAISSGMQSALRVVTGVGSAFKNAGSKIVSMIADGIKSAASKVTGAAKDLMGKVRNLLPFSPAKDGPLTDLHKLNFGGTIADSIKRGQSIAVSAANTMMDSIKNATDPNINIGATMSNSRLNNQATAGENAGGRPIIIHNITNLDGEVIARGTFEHTDNLLGNKTSYDERWDR